jgi:transcriptional regulator of NAD metabolism
MGIRGYVIAKLKDSMNENELWELTKKLESLDDVEFAARVIGRYDFVLTIDTQETFAAAVERIEKSGAFEDTVALKIDDIFVKHREIKDMAILKDLKILKDL